MITLPIAETLILAVIVVIYLGVGQRILDRMRLTDTEAITILAVILAGSLLPEWRLFAGVSINPAGGLVPLGVAAYLVVTADRRRERTRAVAAALVTAGLIYFTDLVLPAQPGSLGFDITPLVTPGILAGVVGYLAGRSRRSAFVAGITGMVLTDLAAAAANTARGVTGAWVGIGGAGAFDSVVVSGVLAALVAEAIGETREFISPDADRPPGDQGPPGEGQTPDGSEDVTAWVYASVLPFLNIVGAAAAAVVLVVGGHYLAPRVGNLPLEMPVDEHMILVDASDRLVTATGLRLRPGDRYLDAEDRLYRVVEIDGRTAVAENLGISERLDPRWTPRRLAVHHPLSAPSHTGADAPLSAAAAVPITIFDVIEGDDGGDGADAGGAPRTASIYFTHNDESYVPTSGESSIYGRGGVHDVGDALAENLQQAGLATSVSHNLHLPHDRGAYRRSRRTASEFLATGQTDILVDVHRDATPPRFYSQQIDGEWLTQIRIVVGQQNPNRWANLRFARDIKAVADELVPGLVKGIFDAHGNYNQDLGPRTVLFEFGAHSNSRMMAERATQPLAEVLAEYFRRIDSGEIESFE